MQKFSNLLNGFMYLHNATAFSTREKRIREGAFDYFDTYKRNYNNENNINEDEKKVFEYEHFELVDKKDRPV